MKKIFVAVVSVTAALTLAPLAQASIYDEAVCNVLDEYPSVMGILGIGEALVEEEGYTYRQAGQLVGEAVVNLCPEYIPLMERFINRYGS